jgi:16S rRNA processing protein RimM
LIPVRNRPITLAVIIGAHGVMGEVRLKLFCVNVESLRAHSHFNDGALTLKSIRPGNNIIARFAEIPDRNAAEAARGTELTVPRDALPPLAEGQYYYADLIGLPCVSTDGEDLGVCVTVENFGAVDVIEVERPPENGAPGKRFMVPMTAEAIPAWDRKIVIDSRFAV